MKQTNQLKGRRKAGWTKARRKQVRNLREAEKKKNQRFWKGLSSLDFDARFPDASDYSAGVENIIDAIDEDAVVNIDNYLEKIEREHYEQAVEEARAITKEFAPHCLDSLKDFINNGGDREATVCAIRQRMINHQQYQNRKLKGGSTTRCGKLPRKRGDATGTSS